MNALQPTPAHGARTDAGEWPSGWHLVEGAGFRPRQRLHLAAETPAVPEPQAGLPLAPVGAKGRLESVVVLAHDASRAWLASHGRTRTFKSIMGIRPEVEFIQVGGGAVLPGTQMHTVPVACEAYPGFVGWLRAIPSVATIAVAPLCGNGRNAMKFDIKALDCAFTGLPTVFSDAGLCKTVVVDGKTGLQAQNDAGNWIRQMPRLLEGGRLREWIHRVSGEWALQRREKAQERLRCITFRVFGRETGMAE